MKMIDIMDRNIGVHEKKKQRRIKEDARSEWEE